MNSLPIIRLANIIPQGDWYTDGAQPLESYLLEVAEESGQ